MRVGIVWTFTLVYYFSLLSLYLWETARYRLKYRLKGQLYPKLPTKQLFPALLEVSESALFTGDTSNDNLMTITHHHRDLCLGELVPGSYKTSKLRSRTFCTFRSRDKGICHGFEMQGNDNSWYACLGGTSSGGTLIFSSNIG